MTKASTIPFVYFGSPELSADVLSVLKENGLTPSLIVTAPDRPRGRGQKVSKSPVGQWAEERDIPTLKPAKIDDNFIAELQTAAPAGGWPVFVLVAYGYILPKDLIYLPSSGTLNLHPSLLPKFRGPAPIRSAILEADKTGVSIIKLDEQMDHGPIVAQKDVTTPDWPPTYPVLEKELVDTGGRLLADIIPQWVNEEITATPQNDELATYSHKFTAADGEIDLTGDAEKNLRKIRAFTNWPKAHFFAADGTRILIKQAHLEEGELVIDTVQPAGSDEVSYSTFRANQNQDKA